MYTSLSALHISTAITHFCMNCIVTPDVKLSSAFYINTVFTHYSLRFTLIPYVCITVCTAQSFSLHPSQKKTSLLRCPLADHHTAFLSTLIVLYCDYDYHY